MAHNLDFSKGFAAFAAVGTPAWHGLGQIVEAMTPQEALQLAGLDFKVLMAPNVHRYPDGSEIVSNTSFFSYRDDTNAILGDRLGAYYTPLQNEEAFGLLAPLCDLGFKVETAGALHGGATVFALMDMGGYKVAGQDQVKTYLLYTNTHDGSKAVSAMFTDVRVVCWNTLQAALFKAEKLVKVRHTTNVEKLTEQALNIMLAADAHKQKAKEGFTKLVETPFSEKRFFDYVCNVFLDNKEREALQRGGEDAISTRKKNLLTAFFDYAQYGPGQKEYMGTAWGAYNAVTGYLGNVKSYKSPDTRMASLLWGESETIGNRALELAAVPARLEPLSKTSGIDTLLN